MGTCIGETEHARMATRTIKNRQGEDMTISSPDLTEADLAVAEILLEMTAEQGAARIVVDKAELAHRLRAKGFDPDTGERLH